MKCEKLFNKIDELYPAYLKVWEDICNIESPTNCKEGVDAVCAYIVKMAEERGWDVEISKQTVAGDVACITINPDAEGEPVCFSGHMDTVHPIGLFGNPPVRVDEEKIYGPGVIDCKGGIVASFLAMDALFQIGFTQRPVKLILQSDEETGSKTSGKKTIEFMCEKAKDAIAFLNTEGTVVNKAWIVPITRKGILRYRLTVSGKAVHSSSCNEGANAIAEAAYKIIELEKMKDPDGLTFNCGIIQGGTVANTVPENCSFVVDIRFATEKEMEEAKEIVNRVAKTVYVEGCSCEVEIVSERPPMEKTDKNVELFNKANEIFTECGLKEIKCEARKGGSDASYITQKGIPCLDSIGVVGDREHSADEYAILTSLAESAKYIASVAYCI